MAWSLEIHHADVTASGDATLIIVREVAPLAGLVARVRTALIDGGRITKAGALHNYIGAQLGATPLNIMVSTHYDIDHLNGLTSLLRRAGRYSNTRVYDQGWPGGVLDDPYIQFVRAINGMNNNGPIAQLAGVARIRVTNTVQSDGLVIGGLPGTLHIGPPGVPAGGVGAIVDGPAWLLGRELLWDGVAGGAPAGAPTLTCIAANRFIRQHGAGPAGPIGGMGNDPRNEKSLALVLRFNNFRYYVGGDIETAQENHVQTFLNHGNNTAGRVLVMKASHHGANTATSRAFVSRVRPDTAIISCGTRNQYIHPAQETVNVLDGYVSGAVAHAAAPPAPPYRPIDYYLTGYQVTAPAQSLGGDASHTAGDPTAWPVVRGDVIIQVSQLQSNSNVRGRLFIGVNVATNAAAVGAGAPGAAAAAAGTAAAEAAISDLAVVGGVVPPAVGVVASAARAAANSLGAAGAVAIAAATAANLAINAAVAGAGPMATAVTAAVAAAGGNVFISAAAGAAAGAAFGGGDGPSIHAAVNAALVAAGVGGMGGVAAAAAAAAAALLAAPAAPGLFDLTYHDMNAMMNPQNLTIV